MLGLFRVKSPVLLESIERKKALASWWKDLSTLVWQRWQRVTSWDFCETHSHGPLCSPNGASPEAVCRHGLPKSIAKTCENHDYSLMENFWKYHQITFKEYTTPSHPARKKHANSKHTSNAANPNIFHMHLPEYWNPLELIHNFSLTFATSPLWAFTKSSLVSCPTSWLSSSAKAPCNKINKATIGYNLVEWVGGFASGHVMRFCNTPSRLLPLRS